VKALPKMQKGVTSKELSAAFKKHTGETEQHIATLEKVFAAPDEKPAAKK
jgi:ferritin-like metal-binding protein YciE